MKQQVLLHEPCWSLLLKLYKSMIGSVFLIVCILKCSKCFSWHFSCAVLAASDYPLHVGQLWKLPILLIWQSATFTIWCVKEVPCRCYLIMFLEKCWIVNKKWEFTGSTVIYHVCIIFHMASNNWIMHLPLLFLAIMHI